MMFDLVISGWTKHLEPKYLDKFQANHGVLILKEGERSQMIQEQENRLRDFVFDLSPDQVFAIIHGIENPEEILVSGELAVFSDEIIEGRVNDFLVLRGINYSEGEWLNASRDFTERFSRILAELRPRELEISERIESWYKETRSLVEKVKENIAKMKLVSWVFNTPACMNLLKKKYPDIPWDSLDPRIPLVEGRFWKKVFVREFSQGNGREFLDSQVSRAREFLGLVDEYLPRIVEIGGD